MEINCYKCKKIGLIYYSGKLLCGECAVKLDNKKREMALRLLDEI